KVAYYNHPPYYYINEKSEPDGYYHELMELISRNLNIKYEYEYVDIKDCIDKLIKNEIDIVFGVSKDTNREKDIMLSNYSIGKEDVSVYVNKMISNENLYELEGLKFGYLENESNNDLFIDMLKRKQISVDFKLYNSYQELKEALINGNVNSIVYLSSDKDLKKYSEIFKFSVGQLYIATSKSNNQLIKNIDLVFEKETKPLTYNSIKALYNKYFNKSSSINKIIMISSIIMIIAVSTPIIIINYKQLKERKDISRIRYNIKLDLKNNNYLLYYQPIINPKDNTIKAFEGLLRLKNKEKIVSPYIFLKDIEKSSMMKEVSLWVLKKSIQDYQYIKKSNHNISDNFYISINLSFREIEDEKFIEKMESLLKDYKLKPNSICLEIVEKFGIKDLQKIQNSIYRLIEAGFMVAIDDFGVEYSNLDILEKIDCDIVKLDKYFIDEIKTSYIRKEVVNFISNVCKYTNKILICEGVENEEQKDFIKSIKNEKFYIQGYFYSKPVDIKEIENLKIKYR
ncbi:MAG: EAL domain-containing protein, partial [Paraclostridium sp.]